MQVHDLHDLPPCDDLDRFDTMDTTCAGGPDRTMVGLWKRSTLHLLAVHALTDRTVMFATRRRGSKAP